jgi:hypothetical protein
MQITLGVYTGERAVLDKWSKTGSKITIAGSVRGGIDAVTPIVTVNRQILPFYNYAYIDTYDSYYYITDLQNNTRDITDIVLSRDPLQTFAAGIKASPAIAARASDNHVNADYPDGKYKVLQSHDTSVINIGNLGLANTVILGFIK